MQTPDLNFLREEIRRNDLADEAEALQKLIHMSDLSKPRREAITVAAAELVRAVRAASGRHLMEAFLAEYGLSSSEGVALMCLAEALLRVPDAATVDELIRDKITPHDWAAHSGSSTSIFVNASTWALMLTGRVLQDPGEGVEVTLRSMLRRFGEPLIRTAVAAAMRELGEQFVLGRSIEEALRRGRNETAKGYSYSYDMLGEAARTEADAMRYFDAYARAIESLRSEAKSSDTGHNPGISVKLSALHPRYEATQRETVLPIMAERLLSLAQRASSARMGLNIDAEEADRLDLSLDVIEQVLSDKSLEGWDGFGIVVQAYSPRASYVVDWLYALAQKLDRRIMVRLVKGAYWDTEIKRAQVLGLASYPVFTRKVNTDVSYIACVRKLLSMTDRIYPQFATHNAHTIATILAMGPDPETFEFQRLHGMGEALHEIVRRREATRCRVYAPVGAHEDLLAYLVRRLLENGANSSFVHQILNEKVSAEEIARDPFDVVESNDQIANPALPAPSEIFCPQRRNSAGWDTTSANDLAAIEAARAPFLPPYQWNAKPLTRAKGEGATRTIVNPARTDEVVGFVTDASQAQVSEAIRLACAAQPGWSKRPVEERAQILLRMADLYEEHFGEFFALAAREAGKNMADSIAELREAVDFLRYYASEAPKAERGTIARGVIACISPWNFPLAIFTGQIAAALVTGNGVIAKPAEQTCLIAELAVRLMHKAGAPRDVLHLLPGDGPTVGAPLTADPRIAGVCFTGSTEVARLIERQLAKTAAPDAMLIAETGGINAMIVDSTALPEQAVRDILASAFQSAGQRCSALRVLYVQKDVETRMVEMLEGAMRTLSVEDPWDPATDVGPVIDDEAYSGILSYCRRMEEKGRRIVSIDAPQDGRFVAPVAFRVSGIDEVEREIFGPVLHVASFEAYALREVIHDINSKGYGLTFGLHTRIDARVQEVVDEIRAGNIYVNRNQIGAVVGSQPFGGDQLSGTGPKAGGPLYLRRFRYAPGGDGREPAQGTSVASQTLSSRIPNATAWAKRTDRIAALEKALDGRWPDALAAVTALEPGSFELPGPTGEANSLTFLPRGSVLCLGAGVDALAIQVIQALAAGNAVLAVSQEARSSLLPLLGQEFPLSVVDGTIDPEKLQEIRFDLVAATGSREWLTRLRRALAAQEGRIVPLVTELVYPQAYVRERAVCVDTTAAGGNASLLAAT